MALTYAGSMKQHFKASIERWATKVSLIFLKETRNNTPLYDFFNRWTIKKFTMINTATFATPTQLINELSIEYDFIPRNYEVK